jgi:hypothetical protein
VDRWRMHYNHRRIQRALGKLTPAAFAARCPAEPPPRLAELTGAQAPTIKGEVVTMLRLS